MTIRERLDHAKQQEYLTVDQLALLLQYNPQTIYRKASRGEIPGIKRFSATGGIRFKRDVVLAWARDVADIRISR